LSARIFLETEKHIVYRKIVFGIVAGRIEHNVFAVCFRPFWNRCLPKCLNKDSCFYAIAKKKLKTLLQLLQLL
jgi:hypothetical protein